MDKKYIEDTNKFFADKELYTNIIYPELNVDYEKNDNITITPNYMKEYIQLGNIKTLELKLKRYSFNLDNNFFSVDYKKYDYSFLHEYISRNRSSKIKKIDELVNFYIIGMNEYYEVMRQCTKISEVFGE